MEQFEEARIAWKQLSGKIGWERIYTLFGDLHVKRYPPKMGESSAEVFKRSIFKGDDDVHAFDAKGVRETIIQRLIHSEQRGIIRPWYSPLAFFAEGTNFLRGVQEETIDYVLRLSLIDEIDKATEEASTARREILEQLDPPIDDERVEYQSDLVKVWATPQLEFFGLLVVMKKYLYIYNTDEIRLIVRFLTNPDETDLFLRIRFLDRRAEGRDETKIKSTKDLNPFIGQDHPRILSLRNLTLEYLAKGDRDYYPARIIQLFLFTLMKADPVAIKFFIEKRAGVLKYLYKGGEVRERAVLRAIAFSKWETTYTRYLHLIKTEYASKSIFSDYTDRLYHLLIEREAVISSFAEEDNFFPIDETHYDLSNLLLELGVHLVETVVKKLESQIPKPMGYEHLLRTIMAKRKANLRAVVIPENLKNELFQEMLLIKNCLDVQDPIKEIMKLIRKPFDVLMPRGEAYFRDMEQRVKEQMEALGDQDLRQELKISVDTPQALVKQFGKTALRLIDLDGTHSKEMDLGELYSCMLALKGTELMFDDATTREERKKIISNSLRRELFDQQLQFVEKLTKLPRIKSFEEEIIEETETREELLNKGGEKETEIYNPESEVTSSEYIPSGAEGIENEPEKNSTNDEEKKED